MRQFLRRLARGQQPGQARQARRWPSPQMVGAGRVTGFTLTLDEANLVERLRVVGADVDLYPVLPLLAASGVTKTGVEVLSGVYSRGHLFHDDVVRLESDGLKLHITGRQS